MAIMKNPPLVETQYILRAKALGSALLADGMKALGDIEGDGAMQAQIMPVASDMRMAGTALTVETDNGDNFPIHIAAYSGKSGYVMVVDGKGYEGRAYLGDLIMGAAHAVGYEGIVCDGCVRDRDGCVALGLPVYAKGFMQRGPIKKNPGNINLPIRCGGLAVQPGDLVVGDCDGVTVVPRARIPEALEKAEEKKAYEDSRHEAIAHYLLCKQQGQPLPQLAPQWVLDMLDSADA